MTDIPRHQAGVSVGLLFTVCHLFWIGLVLTGYSNQAINLLAQAHFVAFQYATVSITPSMAVVGTLGAFATGYLTGWVFAMIWKLSGNIPSVELTR